MTKYPEIEVNLVGQDGNAYAIMGLARKAARQNGVSADEIDAYLEEAMSGDYDNLIMTTMRWFTVT